MNARISTQSEAGTLAPSLLCLGFLILTSQICLYFMIRTFRCGRSRFLFSYSARRLAHSAVRAPHFINEISEMPAPPQPDLPHPAHLDRDSALGRKFGKEVTNYFGGETIALEGTEQGLTIQAPRSTEYPSSAKTTPSSPAHSPTRPRNSSSLRPSPP